MRSSSAHRLKGFRPPGFGGAGPLIQAAFAPLDNDDWSWNNFRGRRMDEWSNIKPCYAEDAGRSSSAHQTRFGSVGPMLQEAPAPLDIADSNDGR